MFLLIIIGAVIGGAVGFFLTLKGSRIFGILKGISIGSFIGLILALGFYLIKIYYKL